MSPEPPRLRTIAAGPDHSRAMSVRRPSKRVLIVEDNELNLKLLRDFLEYHGYCVLATASGEEALEIARVHLPDLILLDIQLPGMNGMQIARQLKATKETCKIPVVAVTAFGMKGDRQVLLGSGFDDYVAKPINIIDMLKLVSSYVG